MMMKGVGCVVRFVISLSCVVVDDVGGSVVDFVGAFTCVAVDDGDVGGGSIVVDFVVGISCTRPGKPSKIGV